MIHVLALGLLLQASPYAPMDYPGADPQLAERIRDLCPVPLTTNRDALLENEKRLATRVKDARQQVTAEQWGKLACGRALLDAIGAGSRASHLMQAGTSWRDGAIDATIYASRLPHPEPVVFELLALLTAADVQADVSPGLAKAMRSAVASGIRSPIVLRACADFAVRTGDADGVALCANTGLAAGQDSTWHLLRLARQHFRDADSLGGMTLFERAAGAARNALAQRDVEWHLQWFVSPEERAAWTTTPDSLRGVWVRDRLVERDLRDGRPPAARLAEHFARLEHVEKHFMLEVPASRQELQRGGAAAFGPETIWREYRRWQVDFDDRGVVWMRFGKPDKLVVNVPPRGERSIETWRYDIDGTPMFVHFTESDFDGSSGTTTLVVGVVGPWQCGIDASRCLLADRRRGIPPEQLTRARDADREYLTVATTKDDNSPRDVRKPIRAVAQLHQLWNVATGEPLMIAAYGLRLDDLELTPDGTGQGVAEVDLVLRWWQPQLAKWNEDSLPRRWSAPAVSRDDTHLSAFKAYPGVGGIGSWGMIAAQPEGRWGRAYGTTAPLASGAMALSDLVVAAESRGLSWVHEGERIFLSPGGTVKAVEPLRLYYQIRSDVAHPQATTSIEVRRITNRGMDSLPAVQLSFASVLRAGITPISRELGLRELRSGRYQLEVRVADKSGALLARRTVVIELE